MPNSFEVEATHEIRRIAGICPALEIGPCLISHMLCDYEALRVFPNLQFNRVCQFFIQFSLLSSTLKETMKKAAPGRRTNGADLSCFRHSREGGNPEKMALCCPWIPAYEGMTPLSQCHSAPGLFHLGPFWVRSGSALNQRFLKIPHLRVGFSDRPGAV